MTIDQIANALGAHGWDIMARSPSALVATHGGAYIAMTLYEGVWNATAHPRGERRVSRYPLRALRAAYAACDSVRSRALLRPALVDLREPRATREVMADRCSHMYPLSTPPRWASDDRKRWSYLYVRAALAGFGASADFADAYLAAIALAGPPPSEMVDDVRAAVMALEEMG